MDLVDIDQVLDNLELREAADESNSSKVTTSQRRTLGQQQQQQQQPPPQPSHHSADAGNASNKEIASASTVATASGGYSSGKSFVGVSQVFNSLDDYRRNVESLEATPPQMYDEECRPISTSAVAAQSKTIQKLDDGNHRAAATASPAPTPAVVNSLQNENEYEDDDEDEEDVDDDDDEGSNDIHKFVENPGGTRAAHADDEAENVTTGTSDSLTTSSSSTFSSGPSPGIVSTTDEHSIPVSPIDVEERVALLETNREGERELQQEEQKEEELVEKVNADPKTGNDSTAASNVQAESGTVLEDLAVGLSSISITTGNSQLNLPGETSVSSVLGNVLDDLTETTSTSFLSQQRDEMGNHQPKLQDSRSFPSVSPSYPDEKDKGAVHPTPVEMEQKYESAPGGKLPYANSKDGERKQQQQQQPPITFGSTMDEISDTELDSMLQEMDIDDVAEENNPKPPHSIDNLNNLQETNEVAVNELQPHLNELQPHFSEARPESEGQQQPIASTILTSTVVNSTAVEDVEPNAGAGGGAGTDHMNADSFSQASTVEFSELKAQNSEPLPIDEEGNSQCSNSAASSYTSTESSLEGDIIAGERAEGEADGAEGEEQSRIRPQRPTTLDLSALKPNNLYANAGQTPPGASQEGGESNGGHLDEHGATGHAQETMESDQEGAANEIAEATGYSDPHANLGKVPPIWVPDNMASGCMQCHTKFTMIKRRHHCRACGKVLCSVCCSQKFKLDFLPTMESRVCLHCYLILTQRQQQQQQLNNACNDGGVIDAGEGSGGGGEGDDADELEATAPGLAPPTTRSPNPNNPMEYCSTIPPHRQVSATPSQPPSVIVPVGVLKKEGSHSSNSSNGSSKKGRKRKSVMFSDGIAPGSDLASMEHQWGDAKQARRGHQSGERSRSAGANKPPTPVKSQPHSSDASTMGLVAQLFRGAIPPLTAGAVIAAAQSTNPHSGGRGGGDGDFEVKSSSSPKHDAGGKRAKQLPKRSKHMPPSGCDENGCFIPVGENLLPPIYMQKDDNKYESEFKEVSNNYELVERLQHETLKFALEKNFFVLVKIVHLKCCMNRTVINFTTCGMHYVGNDELIILLECDPSASSAAPKEPFIPKDIFVHLYEIYREAELGNPISELSYTSPQQNNFLRSREYGGFIFIRSTFQCLQDVIVPENPFLIGILIHRYEVPWAKVFPLRLMLRLGAQYRYYPCPHISIRNRESVYAEIAQTIINFLADFRNYTYTLPCIKGMYIHIEDRQTTVLIPRNRQEDVIKAINNASDHILAFGGNFSKTADGHLVCMQNINDANNEMYAYSTQAINIQGQPRKVTGASFFVLNEALKSTSGLSGKCSIVEDGLMVQILPTKMEEVRNALRNQKDIDIVCGPLDADEQQTEIVSIKWTEHDRDFNIGVKSPIDDKSMEGISSMRVHASFNYSNDDYSIRLTDIFILKFDEWYSSTSASTSLDITRMAEQIARSVSIALVPFLNLLEASNVRKLALRATLHQENVCYEAGARGFKLPPLYMDALDDHLIPTLHSESSGIDNAIILELIFYILNV